MFESHTSYIFIALRAVCKSRDGQAKRAGSRWVERSRSDTYRHGGCTDDSEQDAVADDPRPRLQDVLLQQQHWWISVYD